MPIRIALDGQVIARQPADRRAPGLPTLFRQYGRNHGFDVALDDLPLGRHEIVVTALSIGRRGTNVELLRHTVRVR